MRPETLIRAVLGPVTALCLTFAALLVAALPAAAQQQVDVALVLAVDGSGSVDGEALLLQRQGHAAALTHPMILAAIRQGRHQRIAVAYMEWSGSGNQRLIVPLTTIAGPEDAAAFAERIRSAGGSDQGFTAIGNALQFAGILLDDPEFDPHRRVIDISSNGFWNDGVRPGSIRDMLVAQGITINGLPVSAGIGRSYDEVLLAHFEECVIGGADSFSMPVIAAEDFTAALVNKMTLEIAGLTPPAQARLTRVAGTPRC